MAASVERSPVFRFGVFEVDRRARELRKQGVRLRLQDQPFQVLTLLLERTGEVVTRDELRQKLWPSSVYVDFDHGLNNAIARVREALGDSATAPRFIETLPRLGYRFVHPVEAVPAGNGGRTEDPPEAAPTRPDAAPSAQTARRLRPTLASAATVTAAVVLLGVLAGFWFVQRASSDGAQARPALPEQPSVAVLPFMNLSSDPENEHFTDGLSEELLSKLAGIHGLKVAGRTASFAFKNTRESPPDIARTLNVTHLLEGSVRRSAGRLRITAQLIDAASGYHRWSEVFDREATDIFQIQEDIARAVASALEVELLAADQQHLRQRPTSDPEAYRLYLIARAQIAWVFGRPDWAAVRRAYEEAIARDPEFAAAHAGLAHYYFNRGTSDEDVRRGEAAAERAVALDPELSESLSARANWSARRYFVDGDYSAYRSAVQDFRRALELDPANAQASFHFARAVLFNEPELASALFERTLELDPMRFSAAGFNEYLASWRGEHEAARERTMELYDRNPGRQFHIAIFVATLEENLGRLDEAIVYLNEAQGRGDVGAHRLWALYMSLGDRLAAQRILDAGEMGELGEAARPTMEGRYDIALVTLDHARTASSPNHDLDVATARLALITGRSEQALALLEDRLPDLRHGAEPINARNVLPALDLAAARLWSGEERNGRELLERIAAFLDGPAAPHWPKFVYFRARAHAIAGELEPALQALNRAYEQGFRTTWAVDVSPMSFDYIDPIDADPAFAALRSEARYQRWLSTIEADNAAQLARFRSREAAGVPHVAGARSVD